MNHDKIHRHVSKGARHKTPERFVFNAQTHEAFQGNFRQQQKVVANGQEQEVEHRGIRAIHERARLHRDPIGKPVGPHRHAFGSPETHQHDQRKPRHQNQPRQEYLKGQRMGGQGKPISLEKIHACSERAFFRKRMDSAPGSPCPAQPETLRR